MEERSLTRNPKLPRMEIDLVRLEAFDRVKKDRGSTNWMQGPRLPLPASAPVPRGWVQLATFACGQFPEDVLPRCPMIQKTRG